MTSRPLDPPLASAVARCCAAGACWPSARRGWRSSAAATTRTHPPRRPSRRRPRSRPPRRSPWNRRRPSRRQSGDAPAASEAQADQPTDGRGAGAGRARVRGRHGRGIGRRASGGAGRGAARAHHPRPRPAHADARQRVRRLHAGGSRLRAAAQRARVLRLCRRRRPTASRSRTSGTARCCSSRAASAASTTPAPSFTTHIDFGGFAPGRELLTSFGVAWAASTYAATGYAPARGVDDLLTVKEIAEAELGPAQWTYCVGASMGGGTAQLMAQEFPEEIDGALALCGSLSNVEVVDYLAGWHSVAHWLIGEPIPRRPTRAGLIDWAAALGSVDDGGLPPDPPGGAVRGGDRGAERRPALGLPRGARAAVADQLRAGDALRARAIVAQAPLPAGAVLQHDGFAPGLRYAATSSTARVPRRGWTSTG